MKPDYRLFPSIIAKMITLFAIVNSPSLMASHPTNGCHKGTGHLYVGKNFQTKGDFCYVKVNSLLNESNQMYFIKDLIINCNKKNYLEHYENLSYETIGQQIYRNREEWVGSFDEKLIHHMNIPNSEEVKSFNLYEKEKIQGQRKIYLEFKSENLIIPEDSYKIDLQLADSCIF